MGEENEMLEFKKSTAELQQALDSIVAMLNKHQKGTVYFGVKNDGTPVGQIMGESTLRDVTQAVTSHIEPKIYPSVEKVILNNKECIKVEFEGDDVPYFAYGRAFIRVGDEDKKLSQRELKNLILKADEKTNKWEEKPSDITLDDIDENTIIEFIKKGKKKGRISFDYTNKEDILKKLNLIDNKGNIKNAGYVLFGKSPRIQLRAAIFATSTKTTFIDMQDFTGNIFKLIDDGEQYISKNIRWSVNFNTGTFSRKEIPEVPIRAMRELLCNSFCHRAWNEPYDNDLAIYKDRIEIDNPGFFTNEATPEDYMFGEEPSRPRNPLIAQTMYLSGEIERWGSGIKNVYEKCKEENIDIKLENRKTAFFVIVHRKSVDELVENTEKDLTERKIYNEKLTENEEKVLNEIYSNPNITQKELSNNIGITRRSIVNIINNLKEKSIIERVGSNKKGYWNIKNK